MAPTTRAASRPTRPSLTAGTRGITKKTSAKRTPLPVEKRPTGQVTRPVLYLVLYAASNPLRAELALGATRLMQALLCALATHQDWRGKPDWEGAGKARFRNLLLRLCPCFEQLRRLRIVDQFEYELGKWDRFPNGQVTAMRYNADNRQFIERLERKRGWQAAWTVDLLALFHDKRIGGQPLIAA